MLINKDAIAGLNDVPKEFVDCIITSPPYYRMREYNTPVKWYDGWVGELGWEPTVDFYIAHLVHIFESCKRVLKKGGSLWVVIGDKHKRASAMMIPFKLALRMEEKGWRIPNYIPWIKDNLMPNSASNRFIVDFEMLLWFTKKDNYFFETQYEPYKTKAKQPRIDKPRSWFVPAAESAAKKAMPPIGGKKNIGQSPLYSGNTPEWSDAKGRLARATTFFRVNTKASKIKHYATFPPKLIENMLIATCPKYICIKCSEPRKLVYEEVRVNTRPGLVTLSEKSHSDSDPNKSLHDADVSKYRQIIIRRLKPYGFNSNGEYHGRGQKDYEKMGLQNPSEVKRNTGKSMSKILTGITWTSCLCKEPRYKPGIVLDPFGGTGTVGEVAQKLGLDYIIIEPSQEYVGYAEKRLGLDHVVFEDGYNREDFNNKDGVLI